MPQRVQRFTPSWMLRLAMSSLHHFFDGGWSPAVRYFPFVSINVNHKSITTISITENGNYGDESGVFEYKLSSKDLKGGTVKVGCRRHGCYGHGRRTSAPSRFRSICNASRICRWRCRHWRRFEFAVLDLAVAASDELVICGSAVTESSLTIGKGKSAQCRKLLRWQLVDSVLQASLETGADLNDGTPDNVLIIHQALLMQHKAQVCLGPCSQGFRWRRHFWLLSLWWWLPALQRLRLYCNQWWGPKAHFNFW